MSAVIDKALAEHTIEDWSAEPIGERHQRLGNLLEEQRVRYANLTPAEAHARVKLNQMIVDTEFEIGRVNLAKRYPFPLLSLEPLRWMQDRRISNFGVVPVPKLALLPLQDDRVKISASWWQARNHVGNWQRTIIDIHDRNSQTRYPQPIMDVYQPLRDKLADCQPRRTHFTLHWRFQHVIPEQVKETITMIAPTRDFEAMYLLAETQPEEWYVEQAKKADDPRPPRFQFDPLILGWAHNALWLLDRFDATPLEEYLVSEFAVPVERQLAASQEQTG